MVQPYFEVTIMDLHERFRQQALSYCGAAEVLWKNDLPQNKLEKPHNHYLAPCLLCVGFGYELLCKSVLLKAGLTAKELSKKYLDTIFGTCGTKTNLQNCGNKRNRTLFPATKIFPTRLAG